MCVTQTVHCCCFTDDMHILSILRNRKSNSMLLIQTEEGSLTQFNSVLQLSFHIFWTLSLSVPPPPHLCLPDCAHVVWVCIEYSECTKASFRWKVGKKCDTLLVKRIRKGESVTQFSVTALWFVDPPFCFCIPPKSVHMEQTSTYSTLISLPIPICIRGTKLSKKSLTLCATYAHMRGSRCLVCVPVCVHVHTCTLQLQLAHWCMLLYTEALGQTPSALITAAINQTSTDSCVIPPQCSFLEGATSVNWIWLDTGMMLHTEHLKVIIRR